MASCQGLDIASLSGRPDLLAENSVRLRVKECRWCGFAHAG